MSLIQSSIRGAKHSSCKRTFYFVHMGIYIYIYVLRELNSFVFSAFLKLRLGVTVHYIRVYEIILISFPGGILVCFLNWESYYCFSFTGAALSTQISLDLFGLRLWTRAKCVYKLSRILHKILQKVHKNKNTLSSFFYNHF